MRERVENMVIAICLLLGALITLAALIAVPALSIAYLLNGGPK